MSASVSTPSTRALDFDEAEAWAPEDAAAVAQAEMFDELAPAGLLDEELAALKSARRRRGPL